MSYLIYRTEIIKLNTENEKNIIFLEKEYFLFYNALRKLFFPADICIGKSVK